MLTNMSFVMSNNTNLLDLSIKTLSDVKKYIGGWAIACKCSKSIGLRANSLLSQYVKRKAGAA